MTAATSFLARLELSSPIIPGRRLLLDGILASLLLDRTGDLEAAHRDIPLKNIEGIWCGSQAFLESPAPLRQVQIIGSLRAWDDLTPEIVKPNRGTKYPQIANNKGPYCNSISEYVSFDTAAVWFSGIGDVAIIEDLLSSAKSIGTKRNVGYGQVRKIEVIPLADDVGAHVGLLWVDGSPGRPVPVNLWKQVSSKAAPLGTERIVPPYWKGDQVLCALPELNRIVEQKMIRRVAIQFAA